MHASSRLRGLTLLSTLLSFGPLISGCVTTKPIVTNLAAFHCAQDLPPSYRKPVLSAGLLSPNETVGGLAVKYDAQTANLDRANERTSDVIALVDSCNKRMDDASQELKGKKPGKHFLGL